MRVLQERGDALESGAIITIDDIAARVRIGKRWEATLSQTLALSGPVPCR